LGIFAHCDIALVFGLEMRRVDFVSQKQWLPFQPGIEPRNGLADLILFLHAQRDRLASMQHCAVIPAPEGFSDLMQGGFSVVPSQIHRHLPREYNIRGAPFARQIRKSNTKMFGHLLLNLIDGDHLPGFFPQNIAKKLFHRFAGTPSPIQRLVRGNPRQGALQTPHIGSDTLREKSQDILGKLDMKCLGFFPENRRAILEVRRVQFCG
jgi:hypothetical protein